MKDLKHLTYFENLLLEANNELVRSAQSEGRFAVGQVCSLIPEVLMNVPGCFSVRLRAPHLPAGILRDDLETALAEARGLVAQPG